MVTAFWSNGHQNPTRDGNRLLAWPLSCQYRAYKNDNPKEVQQKAIPLCIITSIALKQATELQRVRSQLIIGAFFFACRSCKYLHVPNSADKKTKRLTTGNIIFQHSGAFIPHSSPLLITADSVSITFKMQTNGRKFDTVTQWATRHASLCPVKQWGLLVKRILAYPGASPTTPVSAVWLHGRLHHMTAKEVSNALRDGVPAFGSDQLQIKPNKIGMHSIRSGPAMAMYLGGVPVFAIQIIGHWSSDAFMGYIRKQVEEFTFDVSAQMLTIQQFTYNATQSPDGRGITEYRGSAELMLG